MRHTQTARNGNGTGEDFEDEIDVNAWSSFSSDPVNGTNERSNYNGFNSSTYSWRMDTVGEDSQLNELVLHLGLIDAERLNLSFATREYGSDNQDMMPASFQGHTDADGIAVSNDGENWYRLWQYPGDVDAWTEFDINITAVSPQLEMDPMEDLYIKFQQYGGGEIPDDGILWDEIYLEGNEEIEFIFDVPELDVDLGISNDVVFCTGQGDGDNETAVVTVTISGKGEEGWTSGEMVRLRLVADPDLEISDYSLAEVEGNIYSSTIGDIMPQDEKERTFCIGSPVPFNGSIGEFSIRYGTWDGDLMDWTVVGGDVFLKARGVTDVDLEMDDGLGGELLIANKRPGTNLTVIAYDQDGEEMPPQDFRWETSIWGVYLVDDDLNTANLIAPADTLGETVTLTATHDVTDMEFIWDINITHGPPSAIETELFDPYVIGEMGIIFTEVVDAYENPALSYRGTMTLIAEAGVVEVDGGNEYNFTEEDKASRAFIVTPQTWGLNSTTVVFVDEDEGISSTPITIRVIAGPVRNLTIEFDWEAMGWDDANGTYHAGDPLYLKVRGRDRFGNPSEYYTKPLVVTHDSIAMDELEPEPWQSQAGDVILQMTHGVAKNYPDNPLRFFKAGPVTLTILSKVDFSVNGTFTFVVNASYISRLVSEPGGADDDPVDVKVGQEQYFGLIAEDEYGNEVTPVHANWSADDSINTIGGGTIMDVPGLFRAIEYFGPEDADGVLRDGRDKVTYSYIEGSVHVTATGPRGQSIDLDIPVRVLNDHDVWIDKKDIEPSQVLAGNELSMKVPIHYDIPPEAIGSDTYEMEIRSTFIDDTGNEIVMLFEKTVLLSGLNSQPNGIEIFTTTVPWEVFGEYVSLSKDRDTVVNHIRTEISDALGGPRLADFERSAENNIAVSTLNVVSLPAGDGTDDYLTYEDSDRDGMDDGWEDHFFGGDADPDADADGDGLSNLEEYELGFDPTDSGMNVLDEGMSVMIIVLIILGAVAILAIAAIVVVILLVKRKKGTVNGVSEPPDDARRIPPEGESVPYGENEELYERPPQYMEENFGP